MIHMRHHASIAIGNYAGRCLSQGKADLVVSYHATRTYPDGRVQQGYFVKRKWLADRAAFNYCPTMGWAYEHWFEWSETPKTPSPSGRE